MKLSFSTRGWPGFSWEEMLETASDMGFAGVEVYNLQTVSHLTCEDRILHYYIYKLAAEACEKVGYASLFVGGDDLIMSAG